MAMCKWRVESSSFRTSGKWRRLKKMNNSIEAVQQRWLSPPALRLFTREGKKEDGTRGRDKRPQSVARYYTWTAVQLVLKLRFNFQSKKKIKTRYGARAELFWQQLNFWVGSGSRLLK